MSADTTIRRAAEALLAVSPSPHVAFHGSTPFAEEARRAYATGLRDLRAALAPVAPVASMCDEGAP